MNFKTTGLLFAALVAFGLAYLLFVPRAGEESSAPQPPPSSASAAARPVMDPPLGEVTRITAKVRGEEWLFEKSGDASPGSASWKMTRPLDLKVQTFEVDRIPRQLTSLQYEISFEPGTPGAVTPAQAGLETPDIVITLADAQGKSAAVEIGHPASSTETYVRVVGQTRILVANASLRTLLKARTVEYRDPQLWNFATDKVTVVEIVDRSAGAPETYRFVRDGARWNIAAPVAARATGKVDELLQAFSRLRVTKWEDDRADRLPAYGLDPAALTVRVTVEEEVPLDNDRPEEKTNAESDADAPGTAMKSTDYVLHVSALSPVGEDTKTYVRVGDESTVASVMKSLTEKFRPVLDEWRDMHLSQSAATLATRVEFSVPDHAAVLLKKEDGWYLEDSAGDAQRADDAAVADLLQRIAALNAAAFVPESIDVLAAANFTKPAAEIRLTVPGVDGAERLVVGGFTDAQTRRLRYARRGDSASIAKVRADDLAPLLAGPRALRDRTMLSLPVEAVSRLSFAVRNPCADGMLEYALVRRDGVWMLEQPQPGPAQSEKVEAFVQSLRHLTALAILDDRENRASLGLDDPDARLTVEYADPPQSVTLHAAARQGKHYAEIQDRPTAYAISPEFFGSLFAEYRSADILRFEAPAVTRFSILLGDQAHHFERAASRWVYTPERDIPLDPKKVENLLLQLHDLKTERYVGLKSDDHPDFAHPSVQVLLELTDGSRQGLIISSSQCTGDAVFGHYAKRLEGDEVFLIAPDALKRFEVSLPELE